MPSPPRTERPKPKLVDVRVVNYNIQVTIQDIPEGTRADKIRERVMKDNLPDCLTVVSELEKFFPDGYEFNVTAAWQIANDNTNGRFG